MNTITLEQEGKGFYLAQTKNSDLAIYSYYLESDKQAWIIDPLYDIKIFEEIIQKRGSKLNSILMTHYHADFISGHLEFKTPLFMGP
jgi:hydroxyacylglutathione hydrolase